MLDVGSQDEITKAQNANPSKDRIKSAQNGNPTRDEIIAANGVESVIQVELSAITDVNHSLGAASIGYNNIREASKTITTIANNNIDKASNAIATIVNNDTNEAGQFIPTITNNNISEASKANITNNEHTVIWAKFSQI